MIIQFNQRDIPKLAGNLQAQMAKEIEAFSNDRMMNNNERADIEENFMRLQNDNQCLEEELRRVKTLRSQEKELYKQEISRLLETVKNEVQRKYHDELRLLLQQVKDLQGRLTDELLTKEKEVRQLHLQH